MSPSRCTTLFLMTVLISPIACLAQSESAENSSASARGRVLFAGDDRPVHHARVEFTLFSTGWAGATFTETDGQFDFEGLSSGTYRVTVTAPGYEKLEETVQVEGRTKPSVLRLHKEYAPAAGRDHYVVSVKELRMSGKGRKAFEKGTRLLLQGNTAESLPYFDRAIAENPEHYRAYYNLGLAHFRLGHIADAEQVFQKSIDLTGGAYAPPQFAMGMILCQQQDFPHAETVIQRGLDVDPGSATGKYYLAWAQFALSRLVEAEKSVQQALLRKANFAEAYFLLARIHQRQNNSPAVVRDLNAYLKLDAHSSGSVQARAFLENTQRALDQNTDSAIVAKALP